MNAARKPLPGWGRKGVRMMPDNVALFATIILLLPMIYFLLSAPAFMLVRLDIPPVAQLLRGMFNGYFLTLAIAGVIGTIAVAVDGRLVLAIGFGLIAAFAASSRRWFCGRWMPGLVTGMLAMPMPCAGCDGCIGAAC